MVLVVVYVVACRLLLLLLLLLRLVGMVGGALYTHPRVSMDSMRTHVESTLSLHGLHEDSMDFRGSLWLYFLQST